MGRPPSVPGWRPCRGAARTVPARTAVTTSILVGRFRSPTASNEKSAYTLFPSSAVQRTRTTSDNLSFSRLRDRCNLRGKVDREHRDEFPIGNKPGYRMSSRACCDLRLVVGATLTRPLARGRPRRPNRPFSTPTRARTSLAPTVSSQMQPVRKHPTRSRILAMSLSRGTHEAYILLQIRFRVRMRGPDLAPPGRAHHFAEAHVAISLACPADNPAYVGLAVFGNLRCGTTNLSIDATV